MRSTPEQRPAVPDELTSPRSKLVYLALTQLDGASATELQQRLNLSKLTLLAVLESLVTNGHVQRTATGYAIQ